MSKEKPKTIDFVVRLDPTSNRILQLVNDEFYGNLSKNKAIMEIIRDAYEYQLAKEGKRDGENLVVLALLLGMNTEKLDELITDRYEGVKASEAVKLAIRDAHILHTLSKQGLFVKEGDTIVPFTSGV